MVLIWIPFLISPPDGQDLAQICSKCQLQFLRLMALPVIEESSYLGFHYDLERTVASPECLPVFGPEFDGIWTLLHDASSSKAAAKLCTSGPCPPYRHSHHGKMSLA